MSGLYVYGIIDGELNVTEELRGMADETVFSVSSAQGFSSGDRTLRKTENIGIAAAVSISEKKRWEVTDELLLTHEHVVESLMSSHTVLPMRYGIIVSNKLEILELIEKRREIIETLFSKVQGKVELGVKVLWHPEPLKRQVESDDLEVEKLRITIKKLHASDENLTGQRYLMDKLYRELIQRKVKNYGEEFISNILEKLASLSSDKVFAKFPTEKLLLSASFLVKKDNVTDFEMLVQQLIKEYQQLSFLFTGPCPPYNFTRIQLKNDY